jgi:hypothetical protein
MKLDKYLNQNTRRKEYAVIIKKKKLNQSRKSETNTIPTEKNPNLYDREIAETVLEEGIKDGKRNRGMIICS